MKQSVKRIVSLALSLALLFCLLPTQSLAAGGVLKNINVQLSHPVAGEYYVSVAYPADTSRYKVTSFDYYPLSSTGAEQPSLSTSKPFVLGTVYRIYVQVKSINGWTIDSDTRVTINGRTAELFKKSSSTAATYTVEIKAGNTIFEDVPSGKWYSEAVDYCFDNSLMFGTGDGTSFSPNAPFTRGMFVTVLARIDKTNLDDYSGTSFTDVKASKWYAPAVEWAFQNQYTSGVGNQKFAPEKGLTRETLAMFLYNYTAKKYGAQSLASGASLSSYADKAKVSAWAQDAVAWAVKEGLISGVAQNGKSYLMPKRIASRAVVAQIVMKYMSNVISKS